MKLAAVVIARNESHGIRSTLERIVAPGVEINVADDDGTPDIAAEFARVVRSPPSRGRQSAIGAAAASADVAALVFVRADTWLPAGYAQAIERCMAIGQSRWRLSAWLRRPGPFAPCARLGAQPASAPDRNLLG